MMTIVGHLTLDEIMMKGGIHYSMGGVTCYAALAARLLGSDVKIVSNIGPDFPKKYLDLLGRMGVDISGVQIDPNSRTTSFQLNYLGSERRLKLLSRAKNISLEGVEGEAVYLGPVAWEIDLVDIRRFLMRHGRTVLDPQGLMREVGDDGNIALKSISLELPNLWILRISNEEARVISESLDQNKMLESLKSTKARIIILTLGAEGALIHDGRRNIKVPSYKVREVDPTGAGDVFGGAFVAEYLNSKDLELAAAMGSAASSLAVEEIGFRSLISPSARYEVRKRGWKIYESIVEL